MKNIDQIYKEHFKTVYKYLLCLTHDSETSEELTQETFLKAIKNIDKFEKQSKMSTWLCSIAKNLWYDELRKKKIKEVSTEELFELEDKSANLEEKSISNENKLNLYKRIQNLDKQTREVFYLKITGDLTFKEIGEILNKTENWARVTFYRGKLKLKEEDRYE